MQDFAADLLTQEGALVEAIEPEGLEVLALSPVRQALELTELCRIGFGATLPCRGGTGGDRERWLDRFGRLLGQHGASGGLMLRPEVARRRTRNGCWKHTGAGQRNVPAA